MMTNAYWISSIESFFEEWNYKTYRKTTCHAGGEMNEEHYLEIAWVPWLLFHQQGGLENCLLERKYWIYTYLHSCHSTAGHVTRDIALVLSNRIKQCSVKYRNERRFWLHESDAYFNFGYKTEEWYFPGSIFPRNTRTTLH